MCCTVVVIDDRIIQSRIFFSVFFLLRFLFLLLRFPSVVIFPLSDKSLFKNVWVSSQRWIRLWDRREKFYWSTHELNHPLFLSIILALSLSLFLTHWITMIRCFLSPSTGSLVFPSLFLSVCLFISQLERAAHFKCLLFIFSSFVRHCLQCTCDLRRSNTFFSFVFLWSIDRSFWEDDTWNGSKETIETSIG